MEKLIVTCCVSGAEVTKEHNPAVPYTVAEYVREAKGAYDAGASLIHLHVREDDGTPTQSKERFQVIMDAIRKACPDIILEPSTGGAVGMSAEERLQPLLLRPEMATLDCGTTNFGDDIFVNTEKDIIAFAERMNELDVYPEIGVFDKGMVDTALRLNKKGIIKGPLYFDFALGLRGGMTGEARDLCFMRDSIPHDALWTVCAMGRYEYPVAVQAITMGGHVRVGFEDNIYVSKGVLAKSNGELVEKIVRFAKEFGRPVATPAEARAILGIAGRPNDPTR